MDATTDLRADHVGVIRTLDVLDSLAARAGDLTAADTTDLAECVEFLRVFVGGCHEAKEEQLLFPAIRSARLADADQMLDRLVADHGRARAAVDRIGTSQGTALADAIGEYGAIVRPHLMLEENGCFDIADRELPAPTQKRLAEGYDLIEREAIGEGRRERFRALLRRLAETYPASA